MRGTLLLLSKKQGLNYKCHRQRTPLCHASSIYRSSQVEKIFLTCSQENESLLLSLSLSTHFLLSSFALAMTCSRWTYNNNRRKGRFFQHSLVREFSHQWMISFVSFVHKIRPQSQKEFPFNLPSARWKTLSARNETFHFVWRSGTRGTTTATPKTNTELEIEIRRCDSRHNEAKVRLC